MEALVPVNKLRFINKFQTKYIADHYSGNLFEIYYFNRSNIMFYFKFILAGKREFATLGQEEFINFGE